MMFTAALVSAGVAALGACFLRAKERARWTGEAIFSGGYLILALTPWISSSLGTTQLLDHIHAKVAASTVAHFEMSRFDQDTTLFRIVSSDGVIHARKVPNGVVSSAPAERVLASIEPANRWRTCSSGSRKSQAVPERGPLNILPAGRTLGRNRRHVVLCEGTSGKWLKFAASEAIGHRDAGDRTRPLVGRGWGLAGLRVAWTRFERGAAEPAARCRTWGRVLAVVALAGTGVGLLRLVIGLWAVRIWRRHGQLVDDPGLTGLLDELRKAMCCRPPVEIREAADLTTAATTGWLRPALLLPGRLADVERLRAPRGARA